MSSYHSQVDMKNVKVCLSKIDVATCRCAGTEDWRFDKSSFNYVSPTHIAAPATALPLKLPHIVLMDGWKDLPTADVILSQ